MMHIGTRLLTFCLAVSIVAGLVPLPDPSPELPPLEPPPPIASPVPVAPAPPLQQLPGTGMLHDIRPSDWFFHYVELGALHGFIQGYDGRFAPQRATTRAEFITMLGRLHLALGGQLREGQPMPPFVDISSDQFFIPYLTWAFSLGAVHPDFEGRFRPEAAISREEVATLLARYIEAHSLLDHFADNRADLGRYADWENISDWAVYAAHLLRNLGLMHGSRGIYDVPGVYYFRPQDETLRQEVFAILGRLFEALPLSEATL